MDVVQNINVALGYGPQLGAKALNQPQSVIPVQQSYTNSELRFGDTQYAVPLRLAKVSSPDDVFTFPLDPIVSFNGGNSIVKREIAKSQIRGTVKELWTQNDWQISVSGVLTSNSECSVDDYIRKLYDLVTADEALIVECDVLNNDLNIQNVVIESYDFPFTKGKENQSFTLSLVSDESYNLEIEQ